VLCPHCQGMGHIRSPESAALHILRAIEDEGAKFRAAEIAVVLPPEIAFYLFNHKRERLSAIEARYAMRVIFTPDAAMTGTSFRIDKIKTQVAAPPVAAPASYAGPMTPERKAEPVAVEEPEVEEEGEDEGSDAPNASDSAEEGERKRRRRRRRGKRRPEGAPVEAAPVGEGPEVIAVAEDAPSEFDLVLAAELAEPEEPVLAPAAEEPVRRRRARGGRRRRGAEGEPEAEAAAPEPVFADVADIFEAAERAEEAARLARQAPVVVEPEPVIEPEPELETVSDAPPPEPLVKPIVIGVDQPVVEKKSGWWRR